MKKLTGFLCVSIFMMACHGSVSVGEVTIDGQKVISNYNSDSSAKTSTKIRNNVQLKENGLKVSEAYLVKEDGSRISDDNIVGSNEKFTLRLIVNGWAVNAGRVKPGASEKIVADDGSVQLDEADLFRSLKDASAHDAQFVSLDAGTGTLQKKFNHITVSFRLWDKVSNADVTGSYQLTLK